MPQKRRHEERGKRNTNQRKTVFAGEPSFCTLNLFLMCICYYKNKSKQRASKENCTNWYSKCFSTFCNSPLGLEKCCLQQIQLCNGPRMWLFIQWAEFTQECAQPKQEHVSSDNSVKFSLVCSK